MTTPRNNKAVNIKHYDYTECYQYKYTIIWRLNDINGLFKYRLSQGLRIISLKVLTFPFVSYTQHCVD